MIDIIVIVFLIMNSFTPEKSNCGDWNGCEDLGSGYFYIYADPHLVDIVYTFRDNYEGSGSSIIPHRVDKVNSNERYIIAQQTDRYADNLIYYWIIDKSIQFDRDKCPEKWDENCDKLLRANVIGPLDSLSFTQELKNRNIGMRFKK